MYCKNFYGGNGIVGAQVSKKHLYPIHTYEQEIKNDDRPNPPKMYHYYYHFCYNHQHYLRIQFGIGFAV